MDKIRTQQIAKEQQKIRENVSQQDPISEKQVNAPHPVPLQRVIEHPAQARPVDVVALRRAGGNQAANHLVQSKLMVGGAGDEYEQEADRVAEQIINGPSAAASQDVQRQEDEEEIQTELEPGAVQRQEDEEEVQTKLEPEAIHRQEDEEEIQTKPASGDIRRQEDEEEIQTKLGSGAIRRQEDEEEIQTKLESGAIRRQEDEEEIQTKLESGAIRRQEDEEEIQTKSSSGSSLAGFQVNDSFESKLKSTRGQGEPLPNRFRSDMESRFGMGFDGVRVHHSSHDGELSRSISAQAFTLGHDIYMGSGKYDPYSTSGKRLLAHELTHVVQQSGGIGRKIKPSAGYRVSSFRTPSIRRVQRVMSLGKFKEDSSIRMARRGKNLRAIDEKVAAFDEIKPKLKPDLKANNPLVAQGMQILLAVDDLCRMWLADHATDSSRSSKRKPAITELQRQAKSELLYMKNHYKVATVPTLATSGKHIAIKDRFEATSASSGLEKLAPIIDKIAPAIKKAPPSTNYEEISGSMDITVDIPLGATGGTLGFHISASAERNLQGLVKVGGLLGITGGYQAGVAGLKAELDGYIEAQAKTSNEVMRLISFTLYRRARESKIVPSGMADLIWGGARGSVGYRRAERWAGKVEKDIFTGATPDIYGESGIKGGLSGSVGDDFGLAGVGVTGQAGTGRRYDVESLTSRGRQLGEQFSRPVGKFYAPQPVKARSIKSASVQFDVRAVALAGSVSYNYRTIGTSDRGTGQKEVEKSLEIYAHSVIPFTGRLYDKLGPEIGKLCKRAHDALVARNFSHVGWLKALLKVGTLPDPNVKLPNVVGKVLDAPTTFRLTMEEGKPPKLNLEYGFDISGGGNSLIVGVQLKRSHVLKSALWDGSNWAWRAD